MAQSMWRDILGMLQDTLATRPAAQAPPPLAPVQSSDAIIAELLALACMRAEMTDGSRDSTALRKLLDQVHVRLQGLGDVMQRVEAAGEAQYVAVR